ncbi:hypothetical protein E2C01_096124 [Portunus trituberculatus]|uniref:Uncharacterized protein n=1 Tax=Portunus trituberculatus TaxID=210409 RepID=A0A5B7K636_PORTR|nr:hypothetical protein [Portunus trituberculatus]
MVEHQQLRNGGVRNQGVRGTQGGRGQHYVRRHAHQQSVAGRAAAGTKNQHVAGCTGGNRQREEKNQ